MKVARYREFIVEMVLIYHEGVFFNFLCMRLRATQFNALYLPIAAQFNEFYRVIAPSQSVVLVLVSLFVCCLLAPPCFPAHMPVNLVFHYLHFFVFVSIVSL